MISNYKVTVPLMTKAFVRSNTEYTIKELKRIGAMRVFLAQECFTVHEEEKKRRFAETANAVKTLKDAGFEVGLWIMSFAIKDKNSYTPFTSIDGEKDELWNCPADEEFAEFASNYMREMAKETNPDIIMLDDDFRYIYSHMGCYCEHHQRLYKEKFGRNITAEEIKSFFTGEKNEGRNKYLEVLGEVLENYAKKLRAKIDEVNPNIRLGHCTNGSNWGVDGTDTIRLANIFAGKTKPFTRLIGAPYWPMPYGIKLSTIIETIRMQADWCKDTEVETMAEGDVYPRPRYNVPSAYLELYDMAVRADGNANGMLRYSFDYTSGAEYETGYNDRYVLNKDYYSFIEENFTNGQAIGVRCYEFYNTLKGATLSDTYNGAHPIQNTVYSHSGKLLTACNIPTVYNGDGICGAVIGENVEKLPDKALNGGLLLDINAAIALQKRGVDVGLISVGEEYNPQEEYFPKTNQITKIWYGKVYKIEIAETATVDGYYRRTGDYSYALDGEKPFESVGSYRYENANGQKFIVLAFNAELADESLYRTYAKSQQIKESIEWLAGKPLPVNVGNHPDLYVMTKQNEEGLAIGLWNVFADSVINPTLKLVKSYGQMEIIGAKGKLNGLEIELGKILPFSFVGIYLRNKKD